MLTPDAAVLARANAAAPRVATMADLPLVADIFADAFMQDPMANWVLRADEGRAAAGQRMHNFLAAADIPKGHVYVSADGLAAAQWQPPGPPDPMLTLWQFVLLLPRMVQTHGVSRIGRILRVISFMEAHHPKEPHFYLFVLGVRGEAKGVGVGSAILSATLAHADAARMPAYLENSNPKNTRLYQRHGFETQKILAPAPGAPPLEFMWRPARG